MFTYGELEKKDYADVERFCFRCKQEGLKNNESITAMKWQEFQPPFGQYWVIRENVNNEIVGVSACHRFSDISDTAFRILVRSCMLPEFRIKQTVSLFKNIIVHEPIFKFLAP